MIAFISLAALMLAAALSFVLPTLLRGRAPGDSAREARRKLRALEQARADGILSDAECAAKRAALGEAVLAGIDAPPPPSRAGYAAALAIALLLPAAAIVLYRIVGAPQAVDAPAATAGTDAAPAGHEQNMEQAIAGLEAKLKQNPDDAEGWTLLGRAYEATEHFPEARDALKHAHDLSPDDPDITAAYAEALTVASPTHHIDGEARRLLEQALKAAPDNQRALWLLGIGDYQDKRYDAAIASWRHLLDVMPRDSKAAQSIRHQIANAEAVRDGRPPPPDEGAAEEATSPESSANTASATSGPHLTVKVSLDAKLKDKLAPDDVLYVYAKAASGPPMPLAIQRMKASQLPATVVLSDGMGMTPAMKLSQFPQVIVGARVSKSGNAIAQSGDLQTVSKPLAVDTSAPIELTIDHVVP